MGKVVQTAGLFRLEKEKPPGILSHIRHYSALPGGIVFCKPAEETSVKAQATAYSSSTLPPSSGCTPVCEGAFTILFSPWVLTMTFSSRRLSVGLLSVIASLAGVPAGCDTSAAGGSLDFFGFGPFSAGFILVRIVDRSTGLKTVPFFAFAENFLVSEAVVCYTCAASVQYCLRPAGQP